ncbi:mitochondrial transcription rescue factor 1 [Chrysoperla carnea]|uniref:mitochondrial transcription rescue factor 1 n=1 Tax=Chrysoperla carnea TaxID=189513 RepID=UPI001D07610E|nr:mitochondrial transcription rescue factor 1 [Chrysoperla carnea]
MFKIVNNLLQLNLRSNIRRLKLQDCVRNISSNNVNPVLVNLSACNHIFNHNQVRLKYTQKSKKSQKTEEHDSDEENDWSSEVEKDAKIVKANLNSLRMDLVVKAGLNIARNKVENAFYENKIRINEKKVVKKSANLRVGDEIDFIRGFSKNNSNFLIVSRLIILDAIEKDENVTVVMKRFKSLLIENYKDPWKQASTSED